MQRRLLRVVRFWPVFALLLLATSVSGKQAPTSGAADSLRGRITRSGVARAQAMVDSVFLDRRKPEGFIDGGDWASYMLARLDAPIPENTQILVTVDSAHVTLSGRLQDLPAEARASLGPLSALVDSSTIITADIVQIPSGKGLAHFQLRRVRVGVLPVPETMLRYMLLDVGEKYPALTKSGRDLFVQIPVDGRVSLVAGAVRLTVNSEQNRNGVNGEP